MMREWLLMVIMCTGACAGAPARAETVAVSATPVGESCGGALTQGGLVICRGAPGTKFTVAGTTLTADASGTAQFGIATDAPSVIGWTAGDGAYGDLPIAARHDDYRVIEGVDCDKVDARTEEQKAHAARSWVQKQDAFRQFKIGRAHV